MLRQLAVLVSVLVGCLWQGQARAAGRTVAIAYFDNNTSSPELAPLGKKKRWNEGRESDAKLDPDDWRTALVKNDAGMRKLLALYASKVKK